MLGRRTTHGHFFWMAVEPILHGFEHVLMLPSGDQSLLGCCAAMLDGAALTGVGSVTAQNQSAV
jgi:hypothetical protein